MTFFSILSSLFIWSFTMPCSKNSKLCQKSTKTICTIYFLNIVTNFITCKKFLYALARIIQSCRVYCILFRPQWIRDKEKIFTRTGTQDIDYNIKYDHQWDCRTEGIKTKNNHRWICRIVDNILTLKISNQWNYIIVGKKLIKPYNN